MRVLWVTPQQPGPAGGGGSNHEFELLRALSARHEIEVLTSYGEADVAGIDVKLTTVDFPIHPYPITRLQTTLAVLRSRQPMIGWILRERIPALSAEIRKRRGVDLTHVMMGEIAPVLAAVEGPSSLLLFDSYTRHSEALLSIETIPRRKLRWRLEMMQSRSYERRWYRRATAVACVSPDDARPLSRLLGREVDVIPNPIGDDFFAPSTVKRSPSLVLFVGSMGYPPNTEALKWWMSQIWPRVVERRPDARFLAVGRGAEAPDAVNVLRPILGEQRMALDVPDVRPYYWEAAVTVAPVRLGAGLRNKVIHAFACGSPVVSTSTAAQGTGAEHGEHLLLADDAERFADAVVESLSDPAAAGARAERARALVQDLHAARIVDRFERWWERTVETRRVPT
jgi:glycosyltransferase involved in cell wall biosynthesis